MYTAFNSNEYLTHIRSISKRDPKDLAGRSLKLAEEFGEFAKELLSSSRDQVLEELCDTVIVLDSIYLELGSGFERYNFKPTRV